VAGRERSQDRKEQEICDKVFMFYLFLVTAGTALLPSMMSKKGSPFKSFSPFRKGDHSSFITTGRCTILFEGIEEAGDVIPSSVLPAKESEKKKQ
jgi:hypothetical protein